jgi:WD40-like Beta Propeller Repeat
MPLPSVSPDGKQFAFVRESPDKGESALMAANDDGTGENHLQYVGFRTGC